MPDLTAMPKWLLLHIAGEQVSRWSVDKGNILAVFNRAGHKCDTEAGRNAGKVRTVGLVVVGGKVTVMRKAGQTRFGQHNQIARANVIVCKERINCVAVALRAFPNNIPLNHV